MDADKRESAINKLIKLMALAESDNTNEADNARRMAEKYRAQFNINGDDVEATRIKSADSKLFKRSFDKYQSALASSIARAFECGVVHHTSFNGAFLRFYGIGHNAKLAEYCYDVLRRQLNREATLFMATRGKRIRVAKNRRAAIGDYKLGWLYSVRNIVDEFNQRGVPESVTRHIDQQLGIETATAPKFTPVGRHDYLSRGLRDGRNARLNRPMGGGAAQKRLGT